MKTHNKTPHNLPVETTPPQKKEESNNDVSTDHQRHMHDGSICCGPQTQGKRERTFKKPIRQRKEVKCIFLLPFVAIVALQVLLFPNIHFGGPLCLQPIVLRAHKRHLLPNHHKHKCRQAPCPHNNHYLWRSCLLLLYAKVLFTTPLAPTTTTVTHYYYTSPHGTSVISPHNLRYNNNWVLSCGDTHQPNTPQEKAAM